MAVLHKIDNLVIHHSESPDMGTLDWEGIRNYHRRNLDFDDIGYHFGLEAYGLGYQILVGRFMTVKGAHCRDGGMNSKALGFCIIGNFDNHAPPAEQWNLSIKFSASICIRFELSPETVLGHREAGSPKTCPGKLFDMDKFREGVKLSMEY